MQSVKPFPFVGTYLEASFEPYIKWLSLFSSIKTKYLWSKTHELTLHGFETSFLKDTNTVMIKLDDQMLELRWMWQDSSLMCFTVEASNIQFAETVLTIFEIIDDHFK